MLEELDQVRLVYGPSMELSLAGAELYELTGRRDEAMACLKECKEQILEQRSRYPSYYCLFQYVLIKASAGSGEGRILKTADQQVCGRRQRPDI